MKLGFVIFNRKKPVITKKCKLITNNGLNYWIVEIKGIQNKSTKNWGLAFETFQKEEMMRFEGYIGELNRFIRFYINTAVNNAL